MGKSDKIYILNYKKKYFKFFISYQKQIINYLAY